MKLHQNNKKIIEIYLIQVCKLILQELTELCLHSSFLYIQKDSIETRNEREHRVEDWTGDPWAMRLNYEASYSSSQFSYF